MKPNLKLATTVAIAASLATTNPYEPAPRPRKLPTDDSEALKSANAKINKVRQERRLWLLKEREVRSLNCRERRELERNIYAEY